MVRHMRVLILIAALILLAALTSRAQVDPGVADTVRVDSTIAYTISGSIAVPVYLTNDQPVSIVEVTLMHHSDDITFDSVSFAGTRLAASSFQVQKSLNDTTLTFGASPQVEVPAGTGMIGKMYFSFPPSVTPQVILFDTTTVTTASSIVYSNTLKSGNDPSYVPQFAVGYLDIQTPPPSLDSVWVDDASVEPGDVFSVDLYLYNERNVLDVTVSLDYGSDYIKIDSVRFAGTRGESAVDKIFSPFSSLHRLRVDLGWTEGTPLAPGSGPIGTLYFTVDSAVVDTSITIDTTSGQPNYITFTAASGGDQITPIYSEGIVTIRVPTDVGDDLPNELPNSFALAQNYPNPFNPSTYIEFSLPTAGHTTIEVFNVLGRRVRTILDEQMPAGYHRVIFDGRSSSGEELSTGVYFYRLKTDEHVASKKMILMK
ncbi:T9SS type A sorting domain-containing protein [bacterium]|nr:T9SS type A sorting domain-containing protein [bacterium]MCB2201573.1 T9SS type A sorting domain-containing protein [bacterium]